MPEIRPVLPRGGAIWFTEEWSEWFRKGFNWRNFHLIEVSYEDACHMGQREIVLFLFGLGLHIQWCYREEAEGLAILQERMAEIEVHPETAIPLAEALEKMRAARAGRNSGEEQESQ